MFEDCCWELGLYPELAPPGDIDPSDATAEGPQFTSKVYREMRTKPVGSNMESSQVSMRSRSIEFLQKNSATVK
ncbi:hypothetical protein BgiMline_020408 [Biomphalaria glabrata]|nr:hypothetical protein BgiMline_017611 [Biomphalaria glabrata]